MVDFVFLSRLPNSCREPFPLQMFIASLTAILTAAFLEPLGVPVMISQILAGIIVGPTFLGRLDIFQNFAFPQPGVPTIKLFMQYGLIFEVLLIGIQIDPSACVKVGRKGLVIGISVVIAGLAMAMSSTYLISATINMHDIATGSLVNVAAAQSLSSFPVIATYLHQQNIVNSELSRIAFSVSMISGIIGYFLRAFGAYILQPRGRLWNISKLATLYSFVLALVLYVFRPVIRWMIKRSPAGAKVKQVYLWNVLIMAILLCWLCEYLMIHSLFGTFAFGLIIPAGSLFGTTLVKRLQYFSTWVIMPVFYMRHGLIIDMSALKVKRVLLVETIFFVSWIGKFLGAALPALYYNMPLKDATLLGLIMNAQGFIEISYFRYLREKKLIDRDFYDIMCVSIVIVTGALSPLVRYLYKSSLKYKLHSRRTIEYSVLDTELRVLPCIFDEESVPSVIHLIKAMNPTKERPICASIIHLVELVGRTVPLIISHRFETKPSADTAGSQRIINVFKSFENDRRSILLDPYTVVSPYATMHNDVCMLALQKRTSMIILPFHKQFPTVVSNNNIRTVNCNVLENAPCSVGILIERGRHSGLKYVYENWSTYHILVLFFGGADDREAIAVAARMSRNPTVQVTVIRFVQSDNQFGDSDSDSDTVDTRYDDETLTEFNRRTANNNRVNYIVVRVDTCAGVLEMINAMEDIYDLVILGRHGHEDVQLVAELSEWDKSSELGTMGDLFTLSGYGGNAAILVVQQQQQTNTAVSLKDHLYS